MRIPKYYVFTIVITLIFFRCQVKDKSDFVIFVRPSKEIQQYTDWPLDVH